MFCCAPPESTTLAAEVCGVGVHELTLGFLRRISQAVRLYRIGGIVSECLYSPGSGLKPPKDSPRPIGRINAGMAVRGSTLWLMGGMLEIGDTEIALDDLWSLDLNKLDCWRCHRELTTLPEDLRPQEEASDSSEWESDDGEGDDDV